MNDLAADYRPSETRTVENTIMFGDSYHSGHDETNAQRDRQHGHAIALGR
jgi:hypothetical protein